MSVTVGVIIIETILVTILKLALIFKGIAYSHEKYTYTKKNKDYKMFKLYAVAVNYYIS